MTAAPEAPAHPLGARGAELEEPTTLDLATAIARALVDHGPTEPDIADALDANPEDAFVESLFDDLQDLAPIIAVRIAPHLRHLLGPADLETRIAFMGDQLNRIETYARRADETATAVAEQVEPVLSGGLGGMLGGMFGRPTRDDGPPPAPELDRG